MSTRKSKSGSNWLAWVQWIYLTALGWLVGAFVTAQVSSLAGEEIGPLVEFWIGLAVGLVQWIQLRPLVRKGGWWIGATGIGWALSLLIIRLMNSPLPIELRGALIGALLGVGQWLVLRRSFRRTAWWIPASILAWTVGQIWGPLLVGAIVGAVTGVALVLLTGNPRLKPDGERGPTA